MTSSPPDSYLYIVVDGKNTHPSKIGITSGSPQERLRGYQTASPDRSFRMFKTWRTAHAKRIEGVILSHAAVMGFRMRGEWLSMSADILAEWVESELEEV